MRPGERIVWPGAPSGHFPSFSEGLSLRLQNCGGFLDADSVRFPFLFGGTFIEATNIFAATRLSTVFPFLFGGTFIEAHTTTTRRREMLAFPFLFGGTFIEATRARDSRNFGHYFPSFSEGLSLRLCRYGLRCVCLRISLPFRRDFH